MGRSSDKDTRPSPLEPADWESFREDAHRALDVALDHVRERRNGPVWREPAAEARRCDEALPLDGAALSTLIDELQTRVLPFTLGNSHPRFWGWVHGSGTPSGIVSHLMMAAINANMGGRDHAPVYIERQVIAWMKSLFGYPEQASGTIVTGTSSATLLGLAVARQRALGQRVREHGNSASDGLLAYCSEQSHVSIMKAMELLGLGNGALRLVPVSTDFAMDHRALEAMVCADLARGLKPFAVISSVGSVNTGAIDSLPAINEICAQHAIWHHVDGAFGALALLSEALRPLLRGIEQADSIAFDFHKWMHVTYAAGCLLVRDGALHRQSFETAHPYLRGERRGIAAGAPWPTDFGVDLSRGFSALGVWFQLKEMGVRRLGEAIERNCEQARWLGRAVEEASCLELLAPVSLNIVCYRFQRPGIDDEQADRLNRRIVVELQCRGIAAPSFTQLQDKAAIRVCITNHRTTRADLQALLEATIALGDELLAGGHHWEAYDISRPA